MPYETPEREPTENEKFILRFVEKHRRLFETDDYRLALINAANEVNYALDITADKLVGGDFGNVSEIPNENIEALKQRIKELLDLLPS